jgi:hypothetical protein
MGWLEKGATAKKSRSLTPAHAIRSPQEAAASSMMVDQVQTAGIVGSPSIRNRRRLPATPIWTLIRC